MDEKRLRILFVEDVPSDAELMQYALRKEGLKFDSSVVETQDTFVAALETFCPDIVISDYIMPAFDGQRALEIALAHNPHLPFIVCTASQNEETAVDCIKAGATDYVLKDRITRLPFAVREALQQRRIRLEKQAAEQALRESEELYRTMFEQAGDYVLLLDIDPDGMLYIVDANDAALDAHDCTREELLGRPISNLDPAATLDFVAEKLHVLGRGSPLLFTTTHRRKDGTLFDVEIHATLVSIRGRKMILSIECDITERKRAEAELRKLSRTVEYSPASIVITDTTGAIEYVNPKFTSVTGYALDEVIGKNPRILKSGHTPPEEYKRLWETIKAGGVWRGEFCNRKKNGDTYWESASISPIANDQGVVTHFVAVKEDITEHKRAEEQLRESEARFATMFRASPLSISLTRVKDKKLIDVNAAWEKLTGWTRAQVIGGTRSDLNLWVTPQEEDRLIETLLVQRKVDDFGIQVRRRSGELVELLLSAVLVELAGEPCMLSIAMDITERKQAEEALRASEVKYRSLFESAAVPIWEEDFAQAKNYLNTLGDWSVQNLHEFLDTHPECLAQCAHLVKVIAVNQASMQTFRANHEDDILRHQIADYFVEESWQVFKDEIVALMAGETKFESEMPFLGPKNKIGSSLIRLSIIPGFEESLARVLVSFIDITERKEMEEMLSTLSRRLFEAQETERRNIARELHDEIGQVLTAVKSNLQTSKLLTDPKMSANFLEESISIVDQALQQVRDLSLNLRPSLLDDFGLVPALEWYLNRQAQRLNLSAQFLAEPYEMKLPQALATTCFRVAQAALTNVERHAHARHVRVDVRLHRHRAYAQGKKVELQLTVSDDGVGFDTEKVLEAAKRGNSLGLPGMQERVRLAGGEMKIHSQPMHGTEIIARFPLVQPVVERRGKRRPE